MIRDKLKNFFKPLMRIDVVLFAGSKERIEHSCPFGSLMRSGEEVVFPTQRIGTDSVFDPIVVNFYRPIVEIVKQDVPAFDGVIQGNAHRTFGDCSFAHGGQHFPQFVHQWQRFIKTQLFLR